MAKTIIASKLQKGDWWNLTDNLAREISVYIGTDKNGKISNPGLNSLLANVKEGDEVDMDIKPGKDGTKLFGWEVRSGGGSGGKTFTSDKPFDAAKIAAQSASTLMSLSKEPTFDKWQELAEKMHGWILSKKTEYKPTI